LAAGGRLATGDLTAFAINQVLTIHAPADDLLDESRWCFWPIRSKEIGNTDMEGMRNDSCLSLLKPAQRYDTGLGRSLASNQRGLDRGNV
jgi:hypothetical protein